MDKKGVMIVLLVSVFMVSLASAGVGIKWEQESILVNEGQSSCIIYKVYNPWNDDSNVVVGVSNELKEILDTQETDSVFVPAQTSSSEAIPINFCFEVPKGIYEKDCLIGGLLCEQNCNSNMKSIKGEIVVSTVPGGSGSGSSTKASVSAPLNVKVRCEKSDRDYTPIYVSVALLALLAVLVILKNKFKKKNSKSKKSSIKKDKKAVKKSKKESIKKAKKKSKR